MINFFGLTMDGEGMILALLMMAVSFCLGLTFGAALFAHELDERDKECKWEGK